jgi:8-oxo-dGTP pyrophosphatase MutT (NUDIX family)
MSAVAARAAPPGAPSGVACAILAADAAVFVLEGDRHSFSPGLRADWRDAFLPDSAPHTVYRVDYESRSQTFPAAALATGNAAAAAVDDVAALTAAAAASAAAAAANLPAPPAAVAENYGDAAAERPGLVMPPGEYGRYILAHMLSKKWFPRCVCEQAEADAFVAAAAHKDRAAVLAWAARVPGEKIAALVALLERFSRAVDGQGLSLVEMVMGGLDGAAETMEAAMARENFEEAGTRVSVSGVPQRVGWSKPFVSRKTGATHCTALFVLRTDRATMAAEWSQAYAARRRTCNWFCAHSWYKFVPGLDQARMTQEKALRETRNGHFLPLTDALAKLDKKNLAVLQRLIEIGAVKMTSK